MPPSSTFSHPPTSTSPASTTSDDGSGGGSSGLSGKSLGILLGFLGAFLLVVAFGYSRRHAHMRALAETHTPSQRTRKRRRGERPGMWEVWLNERDDGKPAQLSDIMPVSVWIDEGPAVHEVSPSASSSSSSRQPIPFVVDYNFMGEAFFPGRNINEVPQPDLPPPPPRPPPRSPSDAATLHVAVIIAMPSRTPRRRKGQAAEGHTPHLGQDVALELGMTAVPFRFNQARGNLEGEGRTMYAGLSELT